MKKHVVEELENHGLSRREAAAAFDMVGRAISNVVKRGDRVRLPGIGTLVVRHRAETRRRNPRTGEPMTIGGYDVVALRNPEKF
jgi:DNA-binding protein HU-beta